MFQQKKQIGKTAVFFITFLFLIGLATMPLFLRADSTGEPTPEAELFLPIVYNKADGTPDPGADVTPTIQPTNSASPTPTPTNTPVDPYIVVVPDCGPGPNIEFNLQGANWPVDQTITLYWENNPQAVFQANTHTGSFNMIWTFNGLSDGIYTVRAISGINEATATDLVYIPCGIQPTNTPAPTNTPTPVTPAPADLIVGQPILVSTPPIIVYEPVAFQVPITNTGDFAIENLFFVDLLFDPQATHFSDVYTAVSGLGSNSTITLTITSTIGFANFVGAHQVTGWVDSLDNIVEADETNNLSDPLEVPIANFGGTPTSTPTPNGAEIISGNARVFLGGSFINQERMLVSAVDEASGLTIAVTYSDENGFYQFDNLPTGTYTVQGCITINNAEYFGFRSGRTPPDSFADIFATEQPCP